MLQLAPKWKNCTEKMSTYCKNINFSKLSVKHVFTFTKTFENSFESNFCFLLKQINEITRNASLTITNLILVNPQIKSDQKQNHFSLLQL